MTVVVVVLAVVVAVLAALAGASIRILREYERAVVFRLGRLLGEKGRRSVDHQFRQTGRRPP